MRVLLALDDTPDGERIASALSAWARDAAPEIHVLSVMNADHIHETSRGFSHTPNVPVVTSSGVTVEVRERPLVLAEDRSQALVRARSERHARLSDIVEKWFPSSEVTVHVEDAKATAQAIIEAADRLAVDVVALGARDRSSLSAGVFGSVHEYVVRHCNLPVLVIGPGAGLRVPSAT